MTHTIFDRQPSVRRPVMVIAFEGWNDAGEAATTAVTFVGAALGAERFATVDPEEFYDFQQTRPTVRLEDNRHRRLEWPAVELHVGKAAGTPRDIVFVRGTEPNLRWRSFGEEILNVARTLGVELIVTVGALLADVPHTRPTQVVGSAGDPQLAERLGLATSRYEGPTGILGVLADAAANAGVPAISLWAACPHYVQASPNPRAALALVERLNQLLELGLDTSPLADASVSYDITVAEMVREDSDLASYVERLEEEADSGEDEDDDEEDEDSLADVPPEQFVAEVERFLRDHPGGNRP